MTKKTDKTLLEAMEKGVMKVLGDEKSTAKEILEAVNTGAKLMQIKHKIKPNDTEEGKFFES